MNRIFLAVGAALGALVIRERKARRAAERMAAATFETLLNAVDANDEQTGRHVRRVASYALVIAHAADLADSELRMVERVALFHDIGKIHEALFDIIHEQSRLTRAERNAIATHPRRGADVLAPLANFYPDLASGVLAHHERWDGSGYPDGLRGERIPLTSRIVAIADTFDAITYKRRYRGGRSVEQAAAAIAEGRGTQFDPQLADLVLSPPVWDRIRSTHRDVHRLHVRTPGRKEEQVPDIAFRWRSKTAGTGTTNRRPDTPRA